MRSRRNRKTFLQVIYEFVRNALVIFFILFIIIVVVQRVSNNSFAVGGFRVFTVVSESMYPKYKLGDILIVETELPKNIKVGDSLCYLGEVNEFANKVITHEVISIQKDNDHYKFTTKGLSNELEDPIVEEHQIYGVVRYKTVFFSFISRVANNKYGFFVLVFLPLACFVLLEMKDLIYEVNDRMNTKARKIARR